MKRSASVLSTALLGAGLMSIGAANAQNALFRIAANATSLTAGSTVTFSIFMTLSTDAKLKAFTPEIVVDSSVFASTAGATGVVQFFAATNSGQIFASDASGQGVVQSASNQKLQAPTDITGKSVLPAGSTDLSTKSAIAITNVDGSTNAADIVGGSENFVGLFKLKVASTYAGGLTTVGFTNALYPATTGAQRNEIDFTSATDSATQANGRLTFANGGKLTFVPPTAVPEPTPYAILGAGTFGLLTLSRRRTRKS